MRTLEYFGRISEKHCICYADANGNPDGQAGINSRVRNKPIGIVDIKSRKFVTKISDSIEIISQEFAPYLDINAEEIKALMLNIFDINFYFFSHFRELLI